MNRLDIFLHYSIKMRKRALKSMLKNLYMGVLIISVIGFLAVFQTWKMISLNIDLIYTYRNILVLIVTLFIFVFTLSYKKTPLECHPASMIHLSGDKFQKIIQYRLYEKIILNIAISFVLSLVLVKFELNVQTLSIQVLIWNLLTLSVVVRHFVYNSESNKNKYKFYLIVHYVFLNIALYMSIYIKFFLLFIITSSSIYCVIRALKISLNFNKLFIELSYKNKVNYLARGNNLNDAQEFTREVSASKRRDNMLLKMIQCNHPLIQKNIITFSRINFFVPIYIFFILIVVIALYKFEIFEFVREIKNSGFGIQIVALHQAMVINNIVDIIVSQKTLLISKSREGLYLSYDKSEIAKSFFVLGAPIILFEVLIVGAIFRVSIVVIFSSFLLYCTVLYLYLRLEKKKKEDISRFISLIIVFTISYYFIV